MRSRIYVVVSKFQLSTERHKRENCQTCKASSLVVPTAIALNCFTVKRPPPESPYFQPTGGGPIGWFCEECAPKDERYQAPDDALQGGASLTAVTLPPAEEIAEAARGLAKVVEDLGVRLCHCGKPIPEHPGRGQPRRSCSPPCANQRHLNKKKAKREAARAARDE